MRTQMIAALALTAVTIAMPADAQRGGTQAGASYPIGGVQGHSMPSTPGGGRPPMPQQTHWNGGGQGQQHWNGGGQGQQHWNGNGGTRWGGQVNGRWSGGWNAPGGWNAYRRPSRGWRLPSYWFTPSFYISDYGDYGLAPPPYGYNWSRYYDDAVLVDGSGRVRDSVGGLNWDGYGDDSGYQDGYQGQGGYDRGAPYPPPDAGYGAGYGGGYAGPPPILNNGVTTTYSTGGYASGGYYYPPVTTTTVTIQSAPSVTTTTTEYVETVKTRYVAKKVWAKKVWRPKPKWHPKPKQDCICGS